MKLSESIHNLLQNSSDRPIQLGQLLEQTGEQGFGIIAGLLTIPMLIPIPLPLAGFSTIFGVGIMLIGLQLAIGYHQPHLPKRFAKVELSPQVVRLVLQNLPRLLQPIERLAQPRLQRVSGNPHLCRLLGLCMSWNAFLMGLPLPIPFTNLLPAYSILFLTIGILELDGYLMLIGYGMTAVTTAFFISISNVIWQLFNYLNLSIGG
jgi:hypothetical protein